MKHFLKKMLLVSAFILYVTPAFVSCAAPNTTLNVAPYLQFRSPSRDTIVKIIGMDHHTHLYDMETYYGTMFIRADYMQSFRPGRLAEALFGPALIPSTGGSSMSGSNDGRSFMVVGSAVPGTGPSTGLAVPNANKPANALMAENFYLPRDFASTVTVKPQTKIFKLDFHFYMALDEWVQGLYFRIFGPYVHERYNLHMSETVTNKGTLAYAQGFFDTGVVPVANLLPGFMAYLMGGIPSNLVTTTADPLVFAKLGSNMSSSSNNPSSGSITKNSFPELRLELTYDFLLDEDYHLGIGIQAAAPTGGRPDARFLFEPNRGNGKSWELGGVVTAHYTFWRSEDEDKHFDFVLETDITHLFKSKQRRTLDLIGKPLSRYMLATKLGTPVVNGLQTSTANPPNGPGFPPATTPVPAQFQEEISPVANFSSQDVKVSVGAQGDLSAMFNFTCRGFSWNIGYNFWGRSTEDVDLRNDNQMAFPANTWALKGDAMVYGFADVESGTIAPDAPIALSATENKATIFTGTNSSSTVPDTSIDAPLYLNFGVDNDQYAYAQQGAGDITRLLAFPVAGEPDTQFSTIQTSNPPIYIKVTDLNLEGAETRGISNTIFTNFNYTFISCENWIPYIDIGGTAEFGGHVNGGGSSSNIGSGNRSIDCALTQWSVWFRLGLSFN